MTAESPERGRGEREREDRLEGMRKRGKSLRLAANLNCQTRPK